MNILVWKCGISISTLCFGGNFIVDYLCLGGIVLKKSFVFAIVICVCLFLLNGCNNRNAESYLSTFSSKQNSGIKPFEGNDETGAYSARTNFVKMTVTEDNSYKYVPILEDIVYDGGTMSLYVEFTFSGDRKSVKSMEGIALLFIDGYMQEFSIENEEKAFIHNVVVPNNSTERFGFSFVPTTYDKDSDKHTMIMVILPQWTVGYGNFIRNSVVMMVGREITLNKINFPKEDIVIQMETREKTDWDNNHIELPFKQDGSNTKPVFHCFAAGETNCYLFCGEELISHEGKCIFSANNKEEKTVSYFGVMVSDSDIGKPLYVLYIPKKYDGTTTVERSCNYLWEQI